MHLIPPYDHDFVAASNAERKFAKLLTAVPADEAVAFHSFHLSRHRLQQMGEADFVVLWEGAVLVLEVKGGTLRRDAGKWYQRGRNGEHLLHKAPLDQAREARFAFADLVKRTLGTDYSYGFALVTPDCMLDDQLEMGPHEYIGLLDMNVVGVRSKFDLMASTAQHRHGQGGHWPKKDLSPLRKVMRRDLDGIMTLVHQAEAVERRRVELLSDQLDFLEAALANPRILLEGGAGTGKTLVALEGARRQALEGADVTFVCATGGALTMARAVLGDAPVSLALSADLPLGEPAGHLVVDEAQDMMNADDLDRISQSVEGGLEQGRWWLLSDINNQTNVTGSYDQDCYDLITDGPCARVRLSRNVRNTDPVIEATQIYLGADIGTARVGAGPAVVVQKVGSEQEAFSRLLDRIRKLKADGVSPSQMAVVTLRQSTAAREDGQLPSEIGGVRVWTPGQIKGLEVQHVMVLGLDDLEDTLHHNLAYVAMTRPAITLWMAASPQAYAYMTARTKQHFSQRKGS